MTLPYFSLSPVIQRPRAIWRLLPALPAALLLAACNGSSTSANSSSVSVEPANTGMQGTVSGGRQPITGATVLVYEAGATAGAAPQQIGAATTNSSGTWNVATFTPTPSAGQLIYVAAIGGNAGAGSNNVNVTLMTVAGTQGSLPSSVNITELSTIASTSQFGTLLQEVPCGSITGSTVETGLCPSINGSANLTTANTNIDTLTSVSSGEPTTTLTSAGSASAAHTTLETLDTLASVLADCVNSTGGYPYQTSNCGDLFGATSVSTAGALSPDGGNVTSSGGTSGNPTGMIVLPNGKFAVIADGGNGTIETFSIGSNGQLAAGSTNTSLTYPYTLATVPGSSNEFVADDSESNQVELISVGSGGAMTVEGSAQSTGNGPTGVVVSPAGYVYVVNTTDGTIGVYKISGNSLGSASSTLSLGSSNYPAYLALSPDGVHAYVTNGATGVSTISVLNINSTTGALTVKSSVGSGSNSGSGPDGIVISPDGAYVYVVNNTDGTVQPFTVSGNTLSPGTALTVGSGSNSSYPAELAISPDGEFLFVSDFGDGKTITYQVGSTGALTQSATSTDSAGVGTQGAAVSPGGNYFYSYNNDTGTVSAFTLVPATYDTLDAAWNLANTSTVNTSGSGVFSRLGTPIVYSPVLSAAPSNWTITP